MSTLLQTTADGSTVINTWEGAGIDAMLDWRIPVMWERLADNVGRDTFNSWVAAGQRFFVTDFPQLGDRTELYPPVRAAVLPMPDVAPYQPKGEPGPGSEPLPWAWIAAAAAVGFYFWKRR